MRANLLFSLIFAAMMAGLPPSLSAQQTLPPGTQAPDPTPAAKADSPLATAEDKMAQHDFNGARPILERYLAAHPDDAQALFDLGYLEDAANHDEQAAALYKKAIAANPQQFEANLAMGLLLARNGQPDEARPYVATATTLEPAVPNPAAKARAYRALAQLDRTSDPSAARSALLAALKISPETPEDTLLTAEIAEASDDPEIAEAAYRQVLQKQPNSSPATAGLAHLLLQQKKYAEAEPLLRSALARDPDDPALNAQLASVLLAQDVPAKDAEALTLLKKLHELEPANPQIASLLADSLTQAGNLPAADAIYLEQLAKTPQNTEILKAHAENLVRRQKFAEAVAVYQQAVKLRPADGDAWSGLAFASSEAHQYSITLNALSMRAKYLPDSPVVYFLWATAYDNVHQSKNAAEYYHKFLAAAGGKFPDQEWQAKHRLTALEKK